MINNKFAIGRKYKFEGDCVTRPGVIRVIDICNDWVDYTILEGMEDDNGIGFDVDSGFASYFTLIEDEEESE